MYGCWFFAVSFTLAGKYRLGTVCTQRWKTCAGLVPCRWNWLGLFEMSIALNQKSNPVLTQDRSTKKLPWIDNLNSYDLNEDMEYDGYFDLVIFVIAKVTPEVNNTCRFPFLHSLWLASCVAVSSADWFLWAKANSQTTEVALHFSRH